MALPGSNYNVKPYVDDGSSLPAVGTRVVSLLDGSDRIEGQVTAVDVVNRTVTFNGFQAQIPEAGQVGGSSTLARSWTYTTLTGQTMPWQYLASTTANTSNYWASRAGT
jgi:hypothetical protein